jgi:hypothetical protein
VGDACDPRPGKVDRLLHFDGFYDDSREPPAGWIAIGTAGAWRTQGGRLEQTATTRGPQILYWNTALGDREAALTLVQLMGTAVVSASQSGALDPEMAAGTEVTPVAGLDDVDGGALETCYLRDAGAPGRLTDDDDITAAGFPGVRTNGVAGSYDYVVIYGKEL